MITKISFQNFFLGFSIPQRRGKSILKGSATLSKTVVCRGMKRRKCWERKTWSCSVVEVIIVITDLLGWARPGLWRARDVIYLWRFYSRHLPWEKLRYLVFPWLHIIINVILICAFYSLSPQSFFYPTALLRKPIQVWSFGEQIAWWCVRMYDFA